MTHHNSTQKSGYISLAIFILLSISYLVLIYHWTALNDFRTADVDDTDYFKRAYELYNLSKINFQNFVWGIFHVHIHKPPLYIYFLSILITIFGPQNSDLVLVTAVLSLNILFVINIFYFFKIVFPDNQNAKNWFLILFTLSPILFSVSKLLLVEILLINLIILSISLAKLWINKMNARRALILGLVLGLGFYTKSTFIFYVLPLLIYIFKEEKEYRKYIVYGTLIAAPWYLANLLRVFNKFINAANFQRHIDGPIYSPRTVFNYSFDLAVAFGFFITIALIIVLIQNRIEVKKIFNDQFNRMIFLGPSIVFILFFCIPNKNERFQYISLIFLLILFSILMKNYKFKVLLIPLLLLQIISSYNICFDKTLEFLPYNRALYTTRPYPFYIPKNIEEFIEPYLEAGTLKVIITDKVFKHDINVEFQEHCKNPRALKWEFKLYRAKYGYNELRNTNKNKKLFLLKISHINEEITPVITYKENHNTYFEKTLGYSEQNNLRFDFYKITD